MVAVYHKSVLLEEVLESLALASGRIFCDVTLGDGGHSKAILERSNPWGLVIGIDRDELAIERTQQRLAPFGDRFKAKRGNFAELEGLLTTSGYPKVDGIVCDLGVSMLQISEPGRGFMFSADGPLNMRMGADATLSAEDIVNDFPEKEIADIIWRYGEEKKSRRIAQLIVKARQARRISTTAALADIVRQAVGQQFLIKSLARVFQSFRIYVNNELDSLEQFLPQAINVLNPGGRLAIIEYHSLESHLIKDFMQRETHPCTCPKELPQCVCGKEARMKIVHRLITASADELTQNPSARSARLRVMEKI